MSCTINQHQANECSSIKRRENDDYCLHHDCQNIVMIANEYKELHPEFVELLEEFAYIQTGHLVCIAIAEHHIKPSMNGVF